MSENDNWKNIISKVKPIGKVEEPIERKTRDIIIQKREEVLPVNYNKKNIGQVTKSEIKRISSGYYKIGMRLDTHGMYQDEAKQYIISQIKKAYAQGIKRILIVTGKGRIDNPSVIKENLRVWLEDSEVLSIITGFSPASAQDGGAGAFYITLKNR